MLLKLFIFCTVVIYANGVFANNNAAPIIFLAGGYGSCTADLHAGEHLRALHTKATALGRQVARETVVITSCFPTRLGRDAKHIGFTMSGSSWQRLPVRDAAHSIARLIADIDHERPIWIIGHSYGGWLATEVIGALLTRRSDANIAFVATLDPVSFIHCTPEELERSIKRTINRQIYNGACVTLPPHPVFANIHRTVGTWLNIYQTQTAYLHAQKISGARNQLRKIKADRYLDPDFEILAANQFGFPPNHPLHLKARRMFAELVYLRPELDPSFHINVFSESIDYVLSELAAISAR